MSPAPRVTPDTQNVRFATAMTGGVSLAIWMGGVARELNLLEQASCVREGLRADDALPVVDPDPSAQGVAPSAAEIARSRYLRLLELLDVTVDVDVLSGTSAGGINAALLGFTRARGLDLGILRDVWLETGAFDRLLRDPREQSPPSLLQGDDVLLKGLNEGIADLVDKGSTPQAEAKSTPTPTPRPTTVFVTTTLLDGETSRFTDNYGTLVQDVEHRGLFRFDRDALRADEHVAALALAARSSASFPAAFEPAFLPCGRNLPTTKDRQPHPDMAPFSNITRDHFAVDGGLLMNRPIRPLIEEVFTREASHQVRRVLLYVVPSPGDAPDPSATPVADKFEEPPTFAGALLRDVGAVLGQSISAELRAIRGHNDTVAGMADTRLRVAELGALVGDPAAHLLGSDALRDYRDRESHALARPIVTALMRALTTLPAEKMPKTWADELGPGGTGEDECLEAIAGSIREPWTEAVPELGSVEGIATFGRGPFDGAKATVIAMLRAGWTLVRDRADREALLQATQAVHDALAPTEEPNLARVVADELKDSTPETPDALATLATQVAESVAANQPTGDLVLAWTALGKAVVDVAPRLEALSEREVPAGILHAERESAKAELRTYLRYLRVPGGVGTSPAEAAQLLAQPRVVASRLFELHVVTRSTLPSTVETEQRVELVQVSADTSSALAEHRKFAKDKLTGLQLHHFGAFYKSSWRANDWMWGRLDGAGWLVHVLLEPRRIQVLAEQSDAANKVDWFLGRVRELFPMLPAADPEVRAELAFLDTPPTGKPPTQLRKLSMWIATAFQRRIVVEELPVLATEVLVNPSTKSGDWAVQVLKIVGAPEAAAAAALGATTAVTTGRWATAQHDMRKWLKEQSAPFATEANVEQRLVEKLGDCPVPGETLAKEVGEPLFTRTVTKAAAVASAATAEAKEMPAVLKPALGTVRKMTLLAYRLAAVNGGNARKLAATGALLVVLGFLMLWIDQVFVGITGVVAIGTGVYLLMFVSWNKIRHFWGWVGFLLAGAAITAGIVLLCDDVRGTLFDTPAAKKGQGWASEHALPWLRDSSWHATAVWFGFVLVVAGFVATIIGLSKKARKNQKDKAPKTAPAAAGADQIPSA